MKRGEFFHFVYHVTVQLIQPVRDLLAEGPTRLAAGSRRIAAKGRTLFSAALNTGERLPTVGTDTKKGPRKASSKVRKLGLGFAMDQLFRPQRC